MPNQHRGSGGARGGHDEERLQQLIGRMRTALQLGLRPSSYVSARCVFIILLLAISGARRNCLILDLRIVGTRSFFVNLGS